MTKLKPSSGTRNYTSLLEFYDEIITIERKIRKTKRPFNNAVDFEGKMAPIKKLREQQHETLNDLFHWILARYKWIELIGTDDLAKAKMWKMWRVAWRERKSMSRRQYVGNGLFHLENILKFFIELLRVLLPDVDPLVLARDYNFYGTLDFVKKDVEDEEKK